MKHLNVIRVGFLSMLILVLSGCTKEKAEAVKVAAENFRSDATLALDQMNYLFNQNVSVVRLSEEEEIQSVVNDLNSIENVDDINSALLDFWSEEAVLGVQAQNSINSEFDNLKAQYYRFEAIFSSLEKGSYFAKDAVKKAEKHAISLTLQLINFAGIIQENDFRFASRRVLIIERMKVARAEENEGLRKQLLENVARDFVELRMEEKRAKDETIRQCLKAAESGRAVAELIKDYDKMNVADILSSIKSSMNFATEITGGNETISNLLTKFEGVESTIKEDAYWKVVLEQDIIKN